MKVANNKAGNRELLKAFVDQEIDLDFISERLQFVGVNRAFYKETFLRCTISNCIAIDLANFMLSEGYTYANLMDMFKSLFSDTLLILRMVCTTA